MENTKLIDLAKKAMKDAYSPYSSFKVGAALLTENEKVYLGCNIENASYGATICAERVAAVKAISDGSNKFIKMAVVCSQENYAFPCGICRQFFSEFTQDCIIILEDKQKGIMEIKFNELFPFKFSLEVNDGK